MAADHAAATRLELQLQLQVVGNRTPDELAPSCPKVNIGFSSPHPLYPSASSLLTKKKNTKLVHPSISPPHNLPNHRKCLRRPLLEPAAPILVHAPTHWLNLVALRLGHRLVHKPGLEARNWDPRVAHEDRKSVHRSGLKAQRLVHMLNLVAPRLGHKSVCAAPAGHKLVHKPGLKAQISGRRPDLEARN